MQVKWNSNYEGRCCREKRQNERAGDPSQCEKTAGWANERNIHFRGSDEQGESQWILGEWAMIEVRCFAKLVMMKICLASQKNVFSGQASVKRTQAAN